MFPVFGSYFIYSDESDAIKKVIEDVTRLLDKKKLFVANHPVGVTSRVKHAIELLEKQQSEDLRLLGICGMGGIGKTTIAKAIYNRIGRNFDGRSFLLNIREVWEQDNGKVYLQESLLHDVFKTTKIVIHNIDSGKNELKDRLCQKKVLLVLDDINELEQMNALFGSHNWFGPGSCIIITTRDEHLVRVRGVDPIIYRLKEMSRSEALNLFSWHAFYQASPKEQFVGLSEDVVAYSSGLPLALEVLGSYLCDKEISQWEDVLEKLKNIQHREIHKKLRISYDGLDDDTQKEIFLDIACFFIGTDRSNVIHILNDCGFYAKNGISVLIERNLVTVDDNNKLGMHHLLRDMGRKIIREESPESEERSRLWIQKEVLEILKKCKATKAIKGLALNLPSTNPISLCTEAFKKMKKLRLLQLAGVQLDGDFKYLSSDLRWMNWYGFPLSHTPKDCYKESLVAIELKSSNLKLVWKEAQLLNKLKILNLSHSHHLRETPDFSYIPNLEKLILKDCPSLSSVSHTIGHLNELLSLNLKDCTSLCGLPRSIYKLKSLNTLIISGCLMIEKLEDDLEQMEALTTLKADNTSIIHVPNALARMKNIAYISLCGFNGLARDVIPSIIWSWTSPTSKFSSLRQTFAGKSSVSLDVVPNSTFWAKCGSMVSNMNTSALIDGSQVSNMNFSALIDGSQVSTMNSSALIDGSKVSTMNSFALIDDCSQDEIFASKNSLSFFLIQMGMNCLGTEILRECISLNSRTSGPSECWPPGDNKNPDWLTVVNGEGSDMTFHVPRVNEGDLKTMMLCIFYSSSPDVITSEDLIVLKEVLITNHTKKIRHVYEGERLTSLKDEDWQSLLSNLEPGDEVQVVVFGHGFTVKQTTVYFIYDKPIDQNMEHYDSDDFVSRGDDAVADMNKNAFGVDDKIADDNVIVASIDDVVANMNENTSNHVDDMAEDGNATVSDVPTDSGTEIRSSIDKNRFGRFFKLPSLVLAGLRGRPFWFALLVIFIWTTCSLSHKRRKLNLISRYTLMRKWLVDCKTKLTAYKRAGKARSSIESSSSSVFVKMGSKGVA